MKTAKPTKQSPQVIAAFTITEIHVHNMWINAQDNDTTQLTSRFTTDKLSRQGPDMRGSGTIEARMISGEGMELAVHREQD